MSPVLQTLALALLGSTATASALTARQVNPYQNTSSSDACSPLHIIVVRASTEVPSQGIIGSLATLITTVHPGSTVEWVQYPALLRPYNDSSYNGTLSTTARLQNYVDTCDQNGSEGKVVLLGYSQGAHVIGDVMCGGGLADGLGPYSAPIDDKYSSKVVAMVQMGDPRFMANKPFDVGTSPNDGIFPRPANISCDKYANIIHSYCDFGDPFCARGNQSVVHLNYTNKYNMDAFNFVQGKIAASLNGSSSSSSSSNSSSSGSKGNTTASSGAVSWTRSSASTFTAVSFFVTVGAIFTFGL